VSFFRLLITCAWAVSLGLFVVFLEAERVRMEHEIDRLERERSRAVFLQKQEVYRYWYNFHTVAASPGARDRLKQEEKPEEQSL